MKNHTCNFTVPKLLNLYGVDKIINLSFYSHSGVAYLNGFVFKLNNKNSPNPLINFASNLKFKGPCIE